MNTIERKSNGDVDYGNKEECEDEDRGNTSKTKCGERASEKVTDARLSWLGNIHVERKSDGDLVMRIWKVEVQQYMQN